MRKSIALVLFYFAFLTAYGQEKKLDDDFLRIRSEADQWMLAKDYAKAKTKYSLALKIKTNDEHCKKRLSEITKIEIQLKANKQEKLRQDRAIEVEARRASSTPQYGTLKGVFDDSYEKFDYTGYILKRRPHGKGKADYNKYNKTAGWEEANWVNGKKNGPATAKYPNGSRYEANYKNDKLEGEFHSFLEDSTVYEQFYKEGKLTGIQRIYYSNKAWAEVESENGKMEGCATAYYPVQGHRMTGYFKDSDVQGEITVYLKDGDILIGTYTNGGVNGPIKVYSANGDRFEGEVKNNFRTGKGIRYYTNGNKLEVVYEKGVIVGEVSYTFINGDRYVGGWKKNKFDGFGKLNQANGKSYEGYWLEDKPHGLGRISAPSDEYIINCPNCITYEGEWKAGLKDGYGKCFDAKGRLLYEGKFVSDKPKDRYPKK
jgi:antitoxin component YwqK of YwqJK toxin-antitoxin module